jgi:hypothetical protein
LKVKTHLKAGLGGIVDAGPRPNHNETLVRAVAKARGLKVKTHLKAGAGGLVDPRSNHNETPMRVVAKGLKVKTHLKAGQIMLNHNETLVRDAVH